MSDDGDDGDDGWRTSTEGDLARSRPGRARGADGARPDRDRRTRAWRVIAGVLLTAFLLRMLLVFLELLPSRPTGRQRR